MKSKKLGKTTSNVEINLTPNGLWLLVGDNEFFLSYKEYPWFMDATVSEIYNVQLFRQHHLHWAALDVDLDLDCLTNPEKYPLTYRH